jgi:hypothetical protein
VTTIPARHRHTPWSAIYATSESRQISTSDTTQE